MTYTVEVDLDDFDDDEILEAARDIVDCRYTNELTKTETLMRDIYNLLIKRYETLEDLESDDLFVPPSTAAGIFDKTHLEYHVHQSKDFKFFSK